MMFSRILRGVFAKGTFAALVWTVLLLAVAHAELNLGDYSAARPLRIMPIGDSITDDCSINGAWRLHLQEFLQTNGYIFVFVGRQNSTRTATFTKTSHEGHCGAVIASPGVFAVHGYTTTNAYLLRIIADALAVTNNRPDLVLIKIGVNDIGRGRDPYHVATNDMPALIDLVLSNVPTANIIVSRITSLQNGTVNTYGAYATNVYIFNAALQNVVNTRRTRGENVFVADMFSAVDYNTMFLSDYVHPNALGQRAIASEWLTRIQGITIRSNQADVTLVRPADTWKFHDKGIDLGTTWMGEDYNDTGWSNGLARLGYGDASVATTMSFGPDAANRLPTTYFRRWFDVPANAVITNLHLRLSRASGALVWLNGKELLRTNLPGGPIAYTNRSITLVSRHNSQIYYGTKLSVAPLPAGRNLLAVEVHQFSSSYPILAMDLELIGAAQFLPAPSLSARYSDGKVVLIWDRATGQNFSLYSTDNPFAPDTWTRLEATMQTNDDRILVSEEAVKSHRFYRLQRE